MSPRGLLATLVAAALAAGCTLGDARSTVRILPEEGLSAADRLQFEIQAGPRRLQALVEVDGREVGTFPTGQTVTVDVAGLPAGTHTVSARVLDGPYPTDRVRRTFEIDRTPPTMTVSPTPGTVYRTDDRLVVELTFSEPIGPADLATDLRFQETGGLGTVSNVQVSADRRSATVTLETSFGQAQSIVLRHRLFDRAGNRLSFPEPEWRAPASPFDLPAGLAANDSVDLPVSVDPAWTGAAGPIRLQLCPPGAGAPPYAGGQCSDFPLAAAPGVIRLDTSALQNTTYGLAIAAPGVRPSPVRTLEVHHPTLFLRSTPARGTVNGPVAIHLEGTGDVPPALDLFVIGGPGGIRQLVATISPVAAGAGFSADVTWDAAVVDGLYRFDAGAAGWQVTHLSGSVVVDRTPPTFSVTALPGHDPWGVLVPAIRPSESVEGTAVMLADGLPVSTQVFGGLVDSVSFPFSFATPATSDTLVTFDVTGLRDEAGNAAAPFAGTMTVPLWFPLAGAGPLALAGTPVVAREAVLVRLPISGTAEFNFSLHFVDEADQLFGVFGGSSSAGPARNTAGSAASGLLVNKGNDAIGLPDSASVAWSEVAADGTTSLRVGTGDLFGSPSVTTPPGASPPRRGASLGTLAWTEPSGPGARRLELQDPVPGPFTPVTGLPIDAVLDCFALQPSQNCSWALAWIDGSGAVPQAALAFQPVAPFGDPPAPWVTVSTSLNANPSQAATEPALHGRHVAWLEGGLVRAGRLDAAGTGFVRDDPTSTAGTRLLRFLTWHPTGATFTAPPVLLFVEPGPGGDVIAARRWIEGTGWTVLSPVNAGVTGEVRTLSTAGSVVTWTDAAGHVYARRLNR